MTATRLGTAPRSAMPRRAFHRTHASASSSAAHEQAAEFLAPGPACRVDGTATDRAVRVGEEAFPRSRGSAGRRLGKERGRDLAARRLVVARRRDHTVEVLGPLGPQATELAPRRVRGGGERRRRRRDPTAARAVPAGRALAGFDPGPLAGFAGFAGLRTRRVTGEAFGDRAQERPEQAGPVVRVHDRDRHEVRPDEHVRYLAEPVEDARDAPVIRGAGRGAVGAAGAIVQQRRREPHRARARRGLRYHDAVEKIAEVVRRRRRRQ